MVTVHRAFGFRFVMFINDHAPPHVHVYGQGGEATIEFTSGSAATVTRVNGIARGDLRRVVAEIQDRRAMLLTAWRTIHG